MTLDNMDWNNACRGNTCLTNVTTCAGGKRKMIDTDAKATALRELEEETAGAHS